MTARSPRAWLAALVLTVAPGMVAAQAPPQPPGPRQPPPLRGEGTEVFRYLFHTAGRRISPIPSIEDYYRVSEKDRAGVILVILGPPRPGSADALQYANEVLGAGGAVLIASDAGLILPRLRITGELVRTSDTSEDGALRKSEWCPFVEPRAAVGARPGPEWAVFDGLRRVATNRPSHIEIDGQEPSIVHRLAGFPNACWTGRGMRLDATRQVFAVGRSGADVFAPATYRLLVMADHSVFINQMLLEPGIDNFRFSGRVVDYLQGPPGQQRTRCLFIENGQVVTDFHRTIDTLLSPPPPINPPSPLALLKALQPTLVNLGNELLSRAERRDVLNTAVLGTDPDRQDSRLRELVAGLLVIASICAVVALLRRVWRARAPTDLPPPVVVPRPGGRDGEPAGLFGRRERELLRRNNLAEPVRELVREFFAAAGAPPEAGRKLPPVRVSREVRRPDTLRAALADLWAIGHGPRRVLTVERWQLLAPLLDRARQAHADGKWRFVGAEDWGTDDPGPRRPVWDGRGITG